MSTLSIAERRVIKRCSKGPVVKLFIPPVGNGRIDGSSDITKEINAFPVRFAPFNRSVRESVGWHDEVDILVYVPYSVLNDLGYQHDEYDKMEYQGRRYPIYKFHPYSDYDDRFLYYLIGGRKRPGE